MTDKDTNPRGLKRPRDGRGMGVGVPSGRRDGRNTEPWSTDGPGQGGGEGRGGGTNRKDRRRND